MNDDAPTRLRDEPEFLALSGLRFEDEAATADVLDVDAGRAALESAVSSGTPSVMGGQEWLATTTAKVGAGLAVTATIASLTLLTVGQGEPSPTVKLPAVTAPAVAQEAPAEVVDPAAVAIVAPAVVPPQAVQVEAPAEAPPVQSSVVKPAASASKAPAPRRRLEPKNAQAIASPQPVSPVKTAGPTSTLPEQLALYKAGKEALAGGDHGAALKAFESYRATFPAGTLRREVGLSMLEALVRGGKISRASRLAKRLLASGGLGARRAEVRRVLGETQVRLGRCDDAALTLATALQEGASGLTLAAVEAAVSGCRSKQEASP